jgi:hypothetical protein
MTARTAAVLFVAALVAAGAIAFGSALAAEGHGDAEPATHMEEATHAEEGGDVEAGGAEAAEAEEAEEGNAVLKVVSAFFIAAGAAALVPLAVLSIRRPEPEAVIERGGADSLRVIAALLTAGAAAIHFAVISEHLRVWWAEGAFFAVAAVIQLLWALAVVIRPTPLLYLVGIAGNAFLALTWVASRTMGVPLGPEAGEAEPIGFVDAMATTYEIVAVVTLLAVLFRAPTARASTALAPASWVVGLLLVPLTALALLDLVEL